MDKQNLTEQKYAFTNQNQCTTTQNKQNKLKPGSVTSYDIRLETERPILLLVLHKSVTYVLT